MSSPSLLYEWVSLRRAIYLFVTKGKTFRYERSILDSWVFPVSVRQHDSCMSIAISIAFVSSSFLRRLLILSIMDIREACESMTMITVSALYYYTPTVSLSVCVWDSWDACLSKKACQAFHLKILLSLLFWIHKHEGSLSCHVWWLLLHLYWETLWSLNLKCKHRMWKRHARMKCMDTWSVSCIRDQPWIHKWMPVSTMAVLFMTHVTLSLLMYSLSDGLAICDWKSKLSLRVWVSFHVWYSSVESVVKCSLRTSWVIVVRKRMLLQKKRSSFTWIQGITFCVICQCLWQLSLPSGIETSRVGSRCYSTETV